MKKVAKRGSLTAQMIGAFWIVGWSFFKFTNSPENIDISDIIVSGMSIAACFTPVYFSIIMDKIKEIKVGNG